MNAKIDQEYRKDQVNNEEKWVSNHNQYLFLDKSKELATKVPVMVCRD